MGIIFLFIGMSVVSSTGKLSKSSFICKSNNPPYEPSNPYPPGVFPVTIEVNFSWNGGDPDPGDTVSYDVYLGQGVPPPLVAIVGPYPANQTRIHYYSPDVLEFDTKYFWYIVAYDNHNAYTIGPIWSFITRGNDPPYEPSDPIPPDGTENWTDGGLCWTGGDPDGDDVMYDVFFGNYSPPPLISQNQSSNCTDLPPWGWLDYNITYYWKVVAWDKYGASTSGPIWSFTTEPNYPPNPAHNPIPPDGANNVPPDAILCWNGSDPNEWDKLTYDVYFGINYPPILVFQNQTEACYDPYGSADMPILEEYYWKIVTWDRDGLHTSSPIWSFKTGPCLITDPEINGPNRGIPEINYNFTFVSTNSYNRSIKYYVDWGDEDTIETGYHASGEVVTLNHTWCEKGEYTIKAIAEDIWGVQSGESEHLFNIPRNKAVTFNFNLLDWFLDRFPFLEVFLRSMNLLR